MNVLVTGVSGYLGSLLATRLRDNGSAVRGFARRAVEAPVPVCIGDAVSGVGLDRALEGIDVAYYLIHSMEPAATAGAFPLRERAAAENFVAAAASAGVSRIIYFGGLVPVGGPRSDHLASRLAVEEILLAGSPCSVAFRASIVIGAGSRSFRFLVRLVERMPVLALPAWRENRTAPIDERDVIEMLARAASSDAVCGCCLDAGGPDLVSYGELIERIRDHMLVARPAIAFRRLSATPIASRLAAIITGEDHELIGPLMDSLHTDLIPRDDRAATLLGVKLHSLDSAIEHALRDWEATEKLSAR